MRTYFVILLFVVALPCKAQTPDRIVLRLKEDTLQNLCHQMYGLDTQDERFTADSLFTRVLVRALRTPFSFSYPFDSLMPISRLYAPDSSFRIFTWQVPLGDETSMHKGAIQMNMKDGSLVLFPLIDRTDSILNPEECITGPEKWIGATYYRILLRNHRNKKIYTLFGISQPNSQTSRKTMDILQFNNQRPVFGDPLFQFPANDTTVKYNPKMTRFMMSYKKHAAARFNFDESLEMVIKEHLISETNEPDKSWTLVGDGDYEGFEWKSGHWKYVKKVFDQTSDQAPTPKPIKKTGQLPGQ
jgi:hypothetical protein